MNLKKVSGGSYGAIIGVSDIDRALKVYSDILGYDKVVYDVTGTFDDLAPLPGAAVPSGAFSWPPESLFTEALVRCSDRAPSS